jgi:multidrug efflux pump subunit AcrB
MTYLQSNSTSNGAMSMTVNFEVGTDINNAALDVQNRVGIANQPCRKRYSVWV